MPDQVRAASCRVRLTAVLASRKVLTMLDPCLDIDDRTRLPLQHAAVEFAALTAGGEEVVDLAVNSFMSVAVTSSGRLFRWGLQPPLLRQQSLDRQARQADNDESHKDITTGSRVCVKPASNIGLGPGAIAAYCGSTSSTFKIGRGNRGRKKMKG